MRVRCSHVRKWRQVAIDGELEKGRHEALEQHLNACGVCRDEFAELLRAVALLSRLPSTQPGASFTSNVLARVKGLRQAHGESPRKRAPWFMAVMAVTAAACVVVGLNEWMLPALVSTMGDGLVLLAKCASLLGPLFVLCGALATLSRSLAEMALTLARSSATHAISVYVLTLAIILIGLALAKTNRRLSEASALCV